MDVEQVRHLTTFAVLVTAVSVSAFTVLYAFCSAWRSTALGWTLLALTGSLSLFVDTWLVFRLFRDENETIALWLLGIEAYLVAITTTLLTTHLILIQRRSRKGRYNGSKSRSLSE